MVLNMKSQQIEELIKKHPMYIDGTYTNGPISRYAIKNGLNCGFRCSFNAAILPALLTNRVHMCEYELTTDIQISKKGLNVDAIHEILLERLKYLEERDNKEPLEFIDQVGYCHMFHDKDFVNKITSSYGRTGSDMGCVFLDADEITNGPLKIHIIGLPGIAGNELVNHYWQIAKDNSKGISEGLEYIDYNNKYFEVCLNDYKLLKLFVQNSANKILYKISTTIGKIFKNSVGCVKDYEYIGLKRMKSNQNAFIHFINWAGTYGKYQS